MEHKRKTLSPSDQIDAIEQLLVESVWYEQRHLSHALARVGLTVPQFVTLRMLENAQDRCPMGTLADMVHQCSATMTGIVDRLVKLGLVDRERSEEDRRSVLVSLTPAGTNILRQTRDGRRHRTTRILSRLTKADQAEALRLTHAILEATKAEDAEELLYDGQSGHCH